MNLQSLTSIQPGNAVTPERFVAAAGSAATIAAAPNGTTTSSPSAIVSLAGSTHASTDAAATYTLPRPSLTWSAAPVDAISSVMGQNLVADRAPGSFRGLGAALLARVATDGTDFSQSVQSTAAVATSSSSDVGLTIVTAGGHTLTLALHAGDGGLGVKLTGAGGLSDAERAALGKLATDFQAALEGMTSAQPRIDLGGLATLDGKLFSSVSLTARTTVPGGATQSVSFLADAQTRSIKLDGPSGKIEVTADLSHPEAWGSQAQRDDAVKQYLGQFDKAASRGHGDPATMALFKDAFSQVNMGYGGTPAGTVSTRSGWLSQGDHALLSGLADFSASLTQPSVASNPLRADEHDAFAYQVSQSTQVGGNDPLNRSIRQVTNSSLHASFHSALSPDATLNLTMLPSSQNYLYTRIDDSAQSDVGIRYRKGQLVEADVRRSAQQSTQTSRYVMGKLVDETSLPAQQNQQRDLLGLLAPLDTKRGLTAREQAGRDATLSALHGTFGLESDPVLLKATWAPALIKSHDLV